MKFKPHKQLLQGTQHPFTLHKTQLTSEDLLQLLIWNSEMCFVKSKGLYILGCQNSLYYTYTDETDETYDRLKLLQHSTGDNTPYLLLSPLMQRIEQKWKATSHTPSIRRQKGLTGYCFNIQIDPLASKLTTKSWLKVIITQCSKCLKWSCATMIIYGKKNTKPKTRRHGKLVQITGEKKTNYHAKQTLIK